MSNVLGFILDEKDRRVILIREVLNGIPGDLKALSGGVESGETPQEALVRLMKDVLGFDSDVDSWTHFLRLEDGFDSTDVFRARLTDPTFAGFADLSGFLDYEAKVWPIDTILQVLSNKRDKNPGFPREYSWMLPLATFTEKNYEVVATEAFDLEALFAE